jgi:hypothetical protein
MRSPLVGRTASNANTPSRTPTRTPDKAAKPSPREQHEANQRLAQLCAADQRVMGQVQTVLREAPDTTLVDIKRLLVLHPTLALTHAGKLRRLLARRLADPSGACAPALCELLAHILAHCGDAVGDGPLLTAALPKLCAQPAADLSRQLHAIMLFGHPAIAEGALAQLLRGIALLDVSGAEAEAHLPGLHHRFPSAELQATVASRASRARPAPPPLPPVRCSDATPRARWHVLLVPCGRWRT